VIEADFFIAVSFPLQTPAAFGTRERRFKAPIEAVDTHRDKPQPKESIVTSISSSPDLSEDDDDDLMKAATSAPPSQVDPNAK
jgi:hypothetical protein